MEELELIEEGWNYFVVCLAKTIPSSHIVVAYIEILHRVLGNKAVAEGLSMRDTSYDYRVIVSRV